MKTDKEITKILAEAVIESGNTFDKDGSTVCFHCDAYYDHKHKPECPVLLAKEVLKDDKTFDDISDIILNGNCTGCPLCIKNEGQNLNIWCKEGYSYPEQGICFTKVKLLLKPETVISEEPLIVHNVLKYKGEYYLKQPSGKYCHGCSFRMKVSSERCILQEQGTFSSECNQNTIWKSFDDIQITDELACMRKDIGDIYLKGALNTLLILKSVRRVYGVLKAIIYIPKNPKSSQLQWTTIDHLRLATAEEIQKYLNGK